MIGRATKETRCERIQNLETLVHEALRDAAVASATPALAKRAEESAARLRQELHRRETLLHLTELSQLALYQSREKYRRMAKSRLERLRQQKDNPE